MSRAPTNAGEPVYVKPANDIYTVLVIVATVVALLGLILWYFKMDALFGGVFAAAPSVR